METLKVGNRYRLRCGDETGPMRLSKDGTLYRFEADVIEPEHDTPSVRSWLANGKFLHSGIDSPRDIIEEISEVSKL